MNKDKKQHSKPYDKRGFFVKLLVMICLTTLIGIDRLAKADSTPLEFGQPVSASIDSAAETDTYTFSASVGDSILLATTISSGSFWTDVSLYSPTGVEVASTYSPSPIEISKTLTESGVYTVLVRDYFGDYTGNYSIVVERLNNPGNTISLEFGLPVSASINPAGNLDLYKFSASSGDSILLAATISSGSFWTDVSLYSPTGVEVASTYSPSPIEISKTLTESGVYTVLVRDYFGDYTGNYSIVVERLNNPGNTISLEFGLPVSASINPAGNLDLYKFSASSGDSILLAATISSGSFWTDVSLYSPTGVEVASTYSPSPIEISKTLTESGVYTVLVRDYFGDYTGNYSIVVERLNNPGNTISLEFGLPVSASINPAGNLDLYKFSASSGDSILLAATISSGSFWTDVSLYSPTGVEVASTYSPSPIEISKTLTESGVYTVLVRDYFGDYTGNYSIVVERLNNPGNTISLEFGLPVSASINPAGNLDLYKFSASSGDSILLAATISSGSFWTDVSLYSPTGVEVASTYSPSPIEISKTLTESGVYTVLVRDYFGDYTGNYSIVVERLNNPGNTISLEFGLPVSASINPAGNLDLYKFSASSGDSILLAATISSGSFWTDVSLYSPTGVEVASTYSPSPIEISKTLTESGVYTVLVRDYFGDYTGNYTLSLGRVTSELLTLGTPYTGSISTDDSNLFSVVTEAGKNLLVVLEPSSPTEILELYGEYGQIPSRSDSDYSTKKRNTLGNYELLITPTKAGTYYFLVYGRSVPDTATYRITASIVNQHISDIYPRTIAKSTGAAVHVLGLGFTDGMKIELRNATASTILAKTAVLSSPEMIIAQFDLSSASLGLYDVVAIWPDLHEEIINSAIEVSELQEGALYALPEMELDKGETVTYDITVPDLQNLFVTLQKSTLVSYGDSWSAKLSVLRGGSEIASTTGSHDLILQVKNPSPGLYTVRVTANRAGSGMLTVWASLPELTLGEWVVGKIYCSYGSMWYQVDMPPAQDKLYLNAEAMGLWSHFDVYYDQYGSSDHWESRQGTTVSMEIPNPVAGTYIVEFLDSAMLYTGSDWSEDQTRDVLIKADTTSTTRLPPSYLPVITSLSTEKGGNAGLVTVEIKGGWLDPNATVSLVRSGHDDINARNVIGDPNKTTLTTTFDLTGKTPGQYNLVVTNPDGHSATAPCPFTIEQGGEANLSVEIIGRDKIRAGRATKVILRVENKGSVDSGGAAIVLSLPANSGISTNSSKSLKSIGINSLGAGPSLGFFTLPLSPGHKIDIPVTFTAPSLAGPVNFSVEYMTIPRPLPTPLPPGPLDIYQPITDFTTPIVTTVFEDNGFDVDEPCLEDLLLEAVKEAFAPNMEWSISSRVYNEETETIIENESSFGIDFPDNIQDIKPPELESSFEQKVEKESEEKEEKEAEVVDSATPEDKYGPVGSDLPGTAPEKRKRFVPADQEFYYKIDFWNKEDATAPACDVFIKDQLDSDLDWDSFRFTEIGFLKWTVKLEPCQYFNVNVDMRPDVNLIVNVEGKFDPNGQINWTFRSLDPYTLQTPEDPMAGFLPPITPSGYEIGWVCVSIDPKINLPRGTQITNQAFVKFDVGPFNPAPKEGPWLNTIGNVNTQISVTKCTVTAGKKVNSDKISLSGTMDATADDFNDVNTVGVAIDSNDMVSPCVLTFPINNKTWKVKKGKYSYSGTENGIKKSFKYDVKTGKFSFAASKVSLCGLACPLTAQIEINTYVGIAEVGESVVNGPKKPIPIKLTNCR